MVAFERFLNSSSPNSSVMPLIVTSVLNPSTNPDDAYSAEFDYASVCLNIEPTVSQGVSFTEIIDVTETGILDVGFNNVRLGQLNIDASSDVRNGYKSFCTSGFVNNSGLLDFTFNLNITELDPSAACFYMIDNVDINCEIVNSRLELQATNLDDFKFKFELVSDGSGSPAVPVSYLWDFGDGNFSNDAAPEHQYSMPGTYQINVDILNSFGCCTTLSFTHEVTFCDVRNLSGLSRVSDLVQLFNVNNVSDLASIDDFFSIDGALFVDVDLVLNDMDIYLTSDSYIEVLPGVDFTISNGLVSNCDGIWDRISVLGSAQLFVDKVEFEFGREAIKLDGASTLSLVDSEFRFCQTGVASTGNSFITNFTNNSFFGGIGVSLTYSPNMNLNAQNLNASNLFSGCDRGIELFRSSATISFNEFSNCNFGVWSTRSSAKIERNIMDQCGTGCWVIRGSTEIEHNEIGYQENGIFLNGVSKAIIAHNHNIGSQQRGIGNAGVRSLHSSADIFDNTIEAGRVGVFTSGTIFSGNVVEIQSNDIHVTGLSTSDPFFQQSGGIRSFSDWNVVIGHNTITGNDLKVGIFGNTGRFNTIEWNTVDVSNNQNGVAITNGNDNTVQFNDVKDSPDNGILNTNSMRNSYYDNDITGSSQGLSIEPNSDFQNINCNNFCGSPTDLNVESELGIQKTSWNRFQPMSSTVRIIGLSTSQIESSLFLFKEDAPADDFLDCGDNMVVVPASPNGLFDVDPDPENEACNNNVGSGFQGDDDPDWGCDYQAQLVANQDWLGISQLIANGLYIADCEVTVGPCKLVLISEMHNELMTSMRTEEDFSSNLSNMINIATDQLTQLTGEPISTPCSDDSNMEAYYEDTYRSRLNQITGITLTESELQSLRVVAALCPHEYGEVVGWAQGTLEIEGVGYFSAQDCERSEVSPRSREGLTSGANIDMKLSPIPVDDLLKIELSRTNFKSGILNLYDVQGRLLISEEVISNGLTTMDVSVVESGLYFLVLVEDEKILLTKKVNVAH